MNPIHKKGPQSDFFKELKDLKVRGGVAKLKQKLDKAFSRDKKKATYDACEKYLKDPNEMSSADYTINLEINLPPVVLAYQYLESANLTEVQSTFVRTIISDYTYDNMVKQVNAVYSESKQEQSEGK